MLNAVTELHQRAASKVRTMLKTTTTDIAALKEQHVIDIGAASSCTNVIES